MNIRHAWVTKLAFLTRKYHLTRLDPFLRMIHNPDNVQNASINRIIQLEDGSFFHVNTASYLEWSMFFYGSYEPFIEKIIKRLVRPGNVCIDVGANIGIHTLTMAKSTGANGHVIAFEPHPQVYKKLKDNIALNAYSWVHVEPCALSFEQGVVTLYGFNGKDSNEGTSSLQAIHEDKQHMFEVTTTTLDDYVASKKLSSVDFIKIDVEGHEQEVIDGAHKSIERFRPSIIFEHCRSHPKQTTFILNILSSYAYRFYQVYYQHLVPLNDKDAQIIAPNILAVPLPGK